jgi:hypothetical protein
MLKDRSRDINPNRVHGCHPSDLSGHFATPFHVSVKKPAKALPAITPQLRLLERILSDITQSDFPAKDHFADHMRQRYRYNCKSSTLRSAAASIKQFLSFYRKTGKQHIEQMTREDIEAEQRYWDVLLQGGMTNALEYYTFTLHAGLNRSVCQM